jgi:hypothetical protein
MMLHALFPALEREADIPVLLTDDCIEPEGAEDALTRDKVSQPRQQDLRILALFCAKEGTTDDWKWLQTNDAGAL